MAKISDKDQQFNGKNSWGCTVIKLLDALVSIMMGVYHYVIMSDNAMQLHINQI